MWMGKLIGNVAILIAGAIVISAQVLAVAVLFLFAALIVMGQRLTHWRTGLVRL